MAPELLLQLESRHFEARATFAADMWSVGCLLLTMLCGAAPFQESTVVATLLRIFRLRGTPSDIQAFESLHELCPKLID